MKNSILLLFIITGFVSCKDSSTEPETTNEETEISIVEKIARANGIEHFDEIEKLNYTFNVKVNDTLRTSRAWEWNTKTGEVSLSVNDSTFSYNHKKQAGEFPDTDQKFINDQYWLLFPFHLVWDKMEYEHQTEASAPISGKQMQKIIVTYPPGAGYTPGDVYEIYFDDDYIIKEWTYRRGGSNENPFSATWEGYETFDGVKISTSHKNADGNFELFFSDIAVE